ncbi:MAG: peptide chain release factor-like protein [Candidatus Nealsonbacteria bacterium]|nr:peptide chain release factor-like protein [Candidatus Nealsonbacteria bacterium]
MSSPTIHPAAVPSDQLLAECDTRRLRRSGPGGQHRNKVETAVVLTHRPTGVMAEANERRSQAENRSVAIGRLRVNLALEVRSARGDDAPPSPLWQSRCPAGRLSVSRSHDDFPTLLAEALDVLAAVEADAARAADRLRCSSSQLVKLLKQEPRALALVNRWRGQRDLHPLK